MGAKPHPDFSRADIGGFLQDLQKTQLLVFFDIPDTVTTDFILAIFSIEILIY